MMSLIDTHIHLDSPELAGRGFGLLQNAKRCGLQQLIVPGVQVSGWAALPAYTQKYSAVYVAPGLHPAYADQWNDMAASQLATLAHHSGVVAIGEIGLDGVAAPSLEQQEVALQGQLDIALAVELPVLLHARKATGALLALLRKRQIGKKVGGVWHGFSGSLPIAQELVALGFKIGIGPVLLRENSKKVPAVVVNIPLTSLVLETDFPDMAETPEALVRVAQKIADLRGISQEEVARTTTANARQLFGF